MKTLVFPDECTVSLMNATIRVDRLQAFRRKEDTPYHCHSHLELHVELSGRTVLEIDSREVSEIVPGDWILLANGVYHEEKVPEPSSGYCLEFEILSAETNSPALLLNDLSWIKKENDPEPGKILGQIFREADENRMGYRDACAALLVLLFTHLIRSISGKEVLLSAGQIAQMNVKIVVDDYFNRVFSGEASLLSLNNLAERLYISPRQTTRVLRKYYGMTFTELLNAARVRYAAYLLKHTSLTVVQIGEKCGVSTTYLIRIFKNSCGTSPNQYRKSDKKDVQ